MCNNLFLKIYTTYTLAWEILEVFSQSYYSFKNFKVGYIMKNLPKVFKDIDFLFMTRASDSI